MKSELNFAKPISGERLLRDLAARYVWWKTPDEALLYPQRIAAQVMNMGDFEDARMLAEELGDDFLRQVLAEAEIGRFNAHSWHYWHYRLELADWAEFLRCRRGNCREPISPQDGCGQTMPVALVGAAIATAGLLWTMSGNGDRLRCGGDLEA